ncbi:MAG: ATP-binding protein [Bacteroidota bacterium]|nr:ATP-binding protein [Bacteroidota bacterium]
MLKRFLWSLNGSIVHEYEGTGVGLSICKKIIDRHRGKITAHAKINEGATFFIDLPVMVKSPVVLNVETDKISLAE